MTTVQAASTQIPGLLAIVNRVLNECALPSWSSLAAMDYKGTLVLDAVNDAVVEIHRKKRWSWTRSTYFYPLVAGQTDYPLPADFESMAYPPIWNGTQLREYTPDDWYAQYPFWSSIASSGGPMACTTDAQFFRIYPAANASAIAAAPHIRIIYQRTAGGRLTNANDNAAFNIPFEFLEAIVAFGKWKLKTFLEYPDADKEYARYQEVIRDMASSDRQTATMYTMRPNVYGNNSEW